MTMKAKLTKFVLGIMPLVAVALTVLTIGVAVYGAFWAGVIAWGWLTG